MLLTGFDTHMFLNKQRAGTPKNEYFFENDALSEIREEFERQKESERKLTQNMFLKISRACPLTGVKHINVP